MGSVFAYQHASAGDGVETVVTVPNGMDGAGTVQDPFQITNCIDLQNVSLNLQHAYVLTGPIDCADTVNWNGGRGFIPIGESYGNGGNNDFEEGNFDGKGYAISHLFIDFSGETVYYAQTGLFGGLRNSSVVNVTLDDATIIAPEDPVNVSLIGGIAGYLSNSNLTDVHFEGSVVVNSCADENKVGGLAGEMTGSRSKINRSSVTGAIQSNGLDCFTFNSNIGGLVGVVTDNVNAIKDSFAAVDISVSGQATQQCTFSLSFPDPCRSIGGLVGSSLYYEMTFINSYAAGSITIDGDAGSNFEYKVGGLIGFAHRFTSMVYQNSFAAMEFNMPADCDINDCGAGPRQVGGIAGIGAQDNTGGQDNYSGAYFDPLISGISNCDDNITNDSNTCQGVNGFDSSSAPISNWDLTDIWDATGPLPVLREAVSPNPDAPTNLTVTILSAISVQIDWQDPVYTGSAPLDSEFGYIYYQKVGDNAWIKTPIYINNGPGSITIPVLSPGTAYNFRLSLQNQDGYVSAYGETSGTTGTPGFYLINSCQQLQDIENDLTANYELTRNIDCSGFDFHSIGVCEFGPALFFGILSGNNYTVSDLTITPLEDCGMAGMFTFTGGALIKDLRLLRPTIVNDGEYAAGTGMIAAIDVGSTISNVHIVDADVEGRDVVGGFFAIEYGNYAQKEFMFNLNSFEGNIYGVHGNSDPVVGGLIGFVYGVPGKTSEIFNNYTNADIEFESGSHGISGGLFGIVIAYGGPLNIENTYASGTMTRVVLDPEDVFETSVGGAIGISYGYGSLLTIKNSFSHVDLGSAIVEGDQLSGFSGNYEDDEITKTVLVNVHFDADLAGTDVCSVASPEPDCYPIEGNSSYFYNNRINPPLNEWDFTNIWATTANLPVFSAKATSAITPVPLSRDLTPIKKEDVTNFLPTIASTSPADTASKTSASLKITRSTPSSNNQSQDSPIIAAIKRFLNKIPEPILRNFPYFLFGVLLLGAGIMFIETLRQAHRLQEINAQIARQASIAEQRDTFWHLAANYLRAPITLLLGGVDLLKIQSPKAISLGAAVATNVSITTKSNPSPEVITNIATLVNGMQVKVSDIMSKIEQSKSLQDISWPKLRHGKTIVRSVRFWIPVGLVAGLSIFANLVAKNFRNITIGTATIIGQIILFGIIVMLVFWVANGLGFTSRKRRQAEEMLARQTEALDQARSTLISQTALVLDADVEKLEALLDRLPAKDASAPILREGARRLRRLVDSFQLLVSAQNHRLKDFSDTTVVGLDDLVKDGLSDLQTTIDAKKLVIDYTAKSASVAGSPHLVQQVVSSVLANAVEFSPEKGKIRIKHSTDNRTNKLTITDNGPGVSKEEQSHIFQLFTKADGQDALQMDHDGLGISLYLDKEIMDYLKGDISIDTSLGAGTTVTITWPKS